MLAKPPILRCYHRVLQVGRNVCERDKFVALLIRPMGSKRLHTPLHLNRGGPRIDPAQQDDSDTAQNIQRGKERRNAYNHLPSPLPPRFHSLPISHAASLRRIVIIELPP